MLLRRAEGRGLRLLLSDGTPASGAELAGYNPNSERILWRATTDDHGVGTVPQSVPGAWLLIRHPHAASLIKSFDQDDRFDGELVLGTAASPLTIQALRGKAILSRAAVAIWLNGKRISGSGLAFLAWSNSLVDSGGTWRAFNLPPKAMQILVSPDKRRLNEGLLDVFSERIDYPWLGRVPVQGVE